MSWARQSVGSSPRVAIGPRRRAPPVRGRSATKALLEEITRIHAENYGVYGARKVWHAMRREGWDIGRARLMRRAGLHGAIRGRKPRTTQASSAPDRRPDLVERNFPRSEPEPALGRRHHLCAHDQRILLHRVRDRRVLPPDRGLGDQGDDAALRTCHWKLSSTP